MGKRTKSQRKRASSNARKSSGRAWLGVAVVVVVVVAAVAIAVLLRGRDRGRESVTRAAASPRLQIPAEPSAYELQSVPRITAVEARQLVADERAVVIDVRDIESYRAGHVPGALQIPLGYVVGELPHFARGRRLIAYCT